MKKVMFSVFAFALAIRPLMAAPVAQVADLLPGQMNAAGFINVRTVMRDYGLLFDGGPLAKQIEQFVAMGLPDPRKEIDQIGFGGTIEKMNDDRFVIATTGSLRVGPLVQFAAQQYHGSVTEEAYRGATFLLLHEPDAEAPQLKAADLTDSSAMGSFDRKGEHPYAELVVDTVEGQNQSYAARYGSSLGADDYAMISAELPKELRKDMERWEQFSFLSLLVHVRGSLKKVGENVRLQLDGVCMDQFDAETVKRALEKVAEYARERFQDPQFQEIIKTIQLERQDNTTTVSIQLPEQVIKDILAGLTGQEPGGSAE